MTVSKMLIYPSLKGNLDEKDIKEIENCLKEHGIEYERYSAEGNGDYDGIIALGGDGTMLAASRLAFELNKPIMSVNFGTLGYMSCLEKSELHLLSKLATGFSTEKRMLIDIKVERKGEIVASATALNEAVISRKADGEILSLELRCDGSTVCDYRADGLIISTPTGSSAYVLSAGGPIIDTKLDAICVCPICPHSLNAKAMVFSSLSVIEAIDNSASGNDLVIADGKALCVLEKGDRVIVEKSRNTLEMIKLKKDAFYETLYNKMS